MQILTAETTTLRTFYVHVVLNDVSFRQISYDIFHMLDTFYLSSFFLKYYFNKLCLQLPQNTTWTHE